jgi:phosphate transport system substrate-binding protein
MTTDQRIGLALLAVTLAVGLAWAGAEDMKITPLSEWTGSVEAEALEKIAPPVVTTAEGWGILWKAWQRPGDVPAVDFGQAVVVVTTTRGSRVSVTYARDGAGNLAVRGLATRDLRPGFRFVLAALPRTGVTAVNGQPLAAAPGHTEPPALPTAKPYKPGESVTGTLELTGSLTMSHLLTLCSQGFARFHPKLKTVINFEGSEEALAERKGDAVTVAALSRPVSEEDLRAWGQKLSHKLLAFPICEDDIAVIVHADNPVPQLSPEQLRMIYAPGNEPLTWGKVGLTGDWADRPITLHGRDEKSGTRHYLRGLAVGASGAERPAKAHPSYRAVVEAVAADPGAIGYCRGVSVTAKVRPVPVGPLARGEVRPYVRRTCHLVVAVPDEQPPAAAREFLLYLYRLDGQSQLFRDGFRPLDKQVINEQLERLGVEDLK